MTRSFSASRSVICGPKMARNYFKLALFCSFWFIYHSNVCETTSQCYFHCTDIRLIQTGYFWKILVVYLLTNCKTTPRCFSASRSVSFGHITTQNSQKWLFLKTACCLHWKFFWNTAVSSFFLMERCKNFRANHVFLKHNNYKNFVKY